MDDFSVGDFAEQLLHQEKGKTDAPVSRSVPGSDSIYEGKQRDISDVEVPQNFLEVITENKDLELVVPKKTLTEDKAELAEENPLAGEAIDIIIEGLGNLLATLKETLNEVKEFVNEHSLVTELTAAGGIGVSMAPTGKKKKAAVAVAVEDEEDTGKEDRVKRILAKVKGKKRVAK